MRKSVLPVVMLIVLATLHEHGDDLTRGDAKYNTRFIDNFLELSGYPGNWTSLPAGTKQEVLETPGALVVGSEALRRVPVVARWRSSTRCVLSLSLAPGAPSAAAGSCPRLSSRSATSISTARTRFGKSFC